MLSTSVITNQTWPDLFIVKYTVTNQSLPACATLISAENRCVTGGKQVSKPLTKCQLVYLIILEFDIVILSVYFRGVPKNYELYLAIFTEKTGPLISLGK